MNLLSIYFYQINIIIPIIIIIIIIINKSDTGQSKL